MRYRLRDIVHDISPDITYVDLTGALVDSTRKGVLPYFVDDSHWVSGDRGVSEWTIVGTMRTGEPAELWGCDLWTFRGGKIAVRNTFWKISRTSEPSPDVSRGHS